MAWALASLRIRRATDAAAIAVAGAATFFLGPLASLTSPVPNPTEIAVMALIAVAWFTMLRFHRQPEVRTIGNGLALGRALRASVSVFAAVAVAQTFLPITGVKALILLDLPVGLALIAVGRIVWQRRLHAQRSLGRSLPRALVVGSARDIDFVLEQLARTRTPAYSIASVVYSDGAPASLMSPAGFPAFDGIEGIADAVEIAQADVVILVSEPGDGGRFVKSLAWHLESTRAQLALAWTLPSVDGSRLRFDTAMGFPLTHIEKATFSGGKHRLKRAFDVVASGAALLMLLPVFAVIALLIKLDSRGPVFFRQERVGLDGSTFSMMKFRSMVVTAESDLAALMALSEGNGVLFKLRADPRVTRVGSILRRYSLDELPQLWNIFIGDMSVVGPRPPLAREVESYDDHVHRRLYVKPGLTGLWQVSGRSDLTWEESVRLDLHYVENWSLGGDLKIIARTVGVVVRPVGAY